MLTRRLLSAALLGLGLAASALTQGTTSERRLTLMPNVPTFAQAGLPGFGMKSWLGFP
ncbi:MAG TPA: hypothetical protein VEA40_22030 [Ramlibacter sp.]|nr:hypothetical protein [Ramlibacter sp.]